MRWFVAALLAFAAAPAPAETVIVTAARMIDVLAGRVVEEPVVVITDGRIAAVGARGGAAPAIPAGARRIDLAGKTLLPGLIDMHFHVGGSPTITGYRLQDYTDNFFTVLGVSNVKATLDSGFTTVRSVGDDDYADVAVQQAVDGGFIPGPRIVAATHLLGATGGHCDWNVNRPSLNRTAAAIADGPYEVRKKVRELRKLGAQLIKICATGGVFSRNTEPGAQQMTYEEIKAAADEAHMLGLRVAAHAHGAAGIKDAIRAGVDTIEHASFIDAEGIRLARKHGTWLVMDIYNTEYTQAEGKKLGIPEEFMRKDRETAQAQRDNFRLAHKAGVKMLFGSDVLTMPWGMAGRQFRVMTDYGMTPMETIQAATRNAAEALGWTADVGAIAVGRYGDIIAVDGDPLADISELEHVDVVIKGGEVVATR
ncbi:MAG TPA: amidohydrolase family protein [Allosphingosinicella sp.]|nr:amidohydrolase family protein [Allosphingosinicella sp.]